MPAPKPRAPGGAQARAAAPPSAAEVRPEVLLAPEELGRHSVKGRTLVLIDVLRFSTTACYALHHGAERLIPVGSIEGATQLAASLDREVTLLCGERESRRIDGFHLGNSPREVTPAAVKGRTLVFSTTNGTRVAESCEASREIALAALVNVTAVARWLLEQQGPVLVVCAGDQGRFAMEDAVCAGLLLERAMELDPALEIEGDAARAALTLAHSLAGDLAGMLEKTAHGRALVALGLGEDLAVAAKLDALSTVPLVREGRITPK